MARLRATPLKQHMVTDVTLERYRVAFCDLSAWWAANRSTPSTLTALDLSTAAYFEALWAEGSTLGVVGDTLSSLSFTFPFARGHLRESWELL